MAHLLLVDDDDLFRESLGLNLIDEGYRVTSFDNGRDALAFLESGGNADVVLLDWRMPELTGIDVLRRIRRSGIAIPVIFLSAAVAIAVVRDPRGADRAADTLRDLLTPPTASSAAK